MWGLNYVGWVKCIILCLPAIFLLSFINVAVNLIIQECVISILT